MLPFDYFLLLHMQLFDFGTNDFVETVPSDRQWSVKFKLKRYELIA